MEAEKNLTSEHSLIAMNGGNGPLSYANNSSYQKAAVEESKALVEDAIAYNLNLKQLPSSSSSTSSPFRMADLGCSIGPNTFIAVQNIIEAVDKMYESHGLHSNMPEFKVYFNDLVSNDFNTLFSSLPHDKQYFAVGVPGSFHGRLFPKASLHFVYSSFALHWLSRIPKQVLDPESPAWSKEKIHYTAETKDLREAYSAQFSKDMLSFLDARAQEVVPGGLMALVIPVVPNGTLPSQSFICLLYELLGLSLMDMAKAAGLLSEAKDHSFNLPTYYASPDEVENLVERNEHFMVEKTTIMINKMKHNVTILDYKLCIKHIRVGTEKLIEDHFGSDIVDDLFDLFANKVSSESSFIFKEEYLRNFVELFIILKRKVFK